MNWSTPHARLREIRTLAGVGSEAKSGVFSQFPEAAIRPGTGNGIVPEVIKQPHGFNVRTTSAS